ncbi:MAG: nucleoside deaminase, partial [Oscillospiraceae bacterium]
MALALEEAKKALLLGEAPVGAVLVRDGELLAAGHNLRETAKNALGHAELVVIDAACRRLGGWRLGRTTLYVTLEPCPMCAGAILNARIERVVFGAFDPKAGSFGSLVDLSK